MFDLQPEENTLLKWSEKYNYNKKELEDTIVDILRPKIKEQGYIDKKDFKFICEWKTTRSKSRCERNDENYIREITGIALSTKNERIRIEILTLLDGVDWPTASVILHFFHDEKYPILDFRALETLGLSKENTPLYRFDFWMEYVIFCRKLSERSNLNMRSIDRALWAYSADKSKQERRLNSN